jgi:hypothetical protein
VLSGFCRGRGRIDIVDAATVTTEDTTPLVLIDGSSTGGAEYEVIR